MLVRLVCGVDNSAEVHAPKGRGGQRYSANLCYLNKLKLNPTQKYIPKTKHSVIFGDTIPVPAESMTFSFTGKQWAKKFSQNVVILGTWHVA